MNKGISKKARKKAKLPICPSCKEVDENREHWQRIWTDDKGKIRFSKCFKPLGEFKELEK